jgi:signal transduction histidine kinase
MSEASSRARRPSSSARRSRTPSRRLIGGLVLSLLTVLGFCLYAAYEIGSLRDRQVATSERNRRDSLQLLRIQNNLSSLAVTLRDMMDRAEPYPMAAWKHTFDRLRVDLTQALDEERGLAPARPAGQQAQLTDAADRFWQAVDRAFTLAAAKDEAGALEVVRQSALPRQAELSGLVSQLLVRNTQVDDDAVAASREVYTRVIRQILLLMAVLLLAVGITGLLNIRATRRAFEDQRTVSRQMRALTWRMLRMQEQLQARVARELHDEFGQILTALTMLISRAKGRLALGAGRTVSQPVSARAPAPAASPASRGSNGAANRSSDDATTIASASARASVTAAGGAGEARSHGTELRLVGGLDAAGSSGSSRTPGPAGSSGSTGSSESPGSGSSGSLEPSSASGLAMTVEDPSLLDTADLEFPATPSSNLVLPPEERGAESFQSTFVRDLEEVEALTKDTLDRIRHDARLLHPSVLDDFGLEEALCAHVLDFGKRHNIVGWFSRNKPVGDVSDDVRANVFRIVQEALTNVGRHSGTDEVWVRLKRKEDYLRVEIEDFGRGLPQWGTADSAPPRRSATEVGLGMIGMRERAEALGGHFDIRRGERGGVMVIVEIPLDARMQDESFGLLDDDEPPFYDELPYEEPLPQPPAPPVREPDSKRAPKARTSSKKQKPM